MKPKVSRYKHVKRAKYEQMHPLDFIKTDAFKQHSKRVESLIQYQLVLEEMRKRGIEVN